VVKTPKLKIHGVSTMIDVSSFEDASRLSLSDIHTSIILYE
jgi:hypothetical protein